MRLYPFVFTGEERNEETCYGYCNDYQPHAVRHIFDEENKTHCDLRWDPAGNLGQISVSLKDNVFDHGRFLFWTEDNRMHAAVDDRYFSYYVYDHSGGSCASREQSQACLSYAEMEQRRRSQRRLKLTGDNKLLDVNADIMATYTFLDNPTLYPSAYMVLTNKGYTKHYYAGTERVAARLGGGGLNALQPVIANDDELQRKADILFRQSLEQVNHRVLGENDLKCIMNNEFARDEFGKRIDGIPYHVRSDVKVDNWQFKNMIHSMLYDRNQGHEKDVYFYHSDHLGSASWITDCGGVAVQHIQYLPYGEPYINQRPFGYSERFTFTGKERDEETGFGYFGARYMDHELMTMWLSVDPMADKYPSISPYAYCAWNPVKLVDPDGRDVWEVSKDGHVQRKSDEGGNKKQIVKYANGKTTTFRGTRYHNIMSDLSSTSANNVSSSYGGENMQFAYANVFKSMADNTDVEWTMHRYKDNHYALGTMHMESTSPSSFDISKSMQNDRSLVTLIHSHPMVSRVNPTSIAEQISSMGYWDWGKKRWRRSGDAWYKKYDFPNTNYYTYFPRTKQLWCNGLNAPAFIRKINSVSDYFFGTYNTR